LKPIDTLEDPTAILWDTDEALPPLMAGISEDIDCPLIVNIVIGQGEQLKNATLTVAAADAVSADGM
jgi:hypothetical protein